MPVRIRYINAPIMERVVQKGAGLAAEVQKEFKPNRKVMELIGEEIIAGFKGGQRLGAIKFGPRGGVTSKGHGSRYPYGIWQQKSPNGKPYEPLKESTIAVKKRDNRPSGLPPSRTPNTALVDMGALVDGLYYRVYSNNDGVAVEFKNSDLTALSLKHERGFTGYSTDFTKKDGGGILVTVPPRPHRQIQREVKIKIRNILEAWRDRRKNG
jgi:hypothetical protein